MKKKIFLAIGTILIAFIGYIAYLMLTTRSHSPEETIVHDGNNVKMSITYCRPFKKDRVIFGTKDEGALQPFGVYWRTGANEATEITFENDVVFNGEQVKAGTYRFYTVPDKEEWTVALNTSIDEWGYTEPDYSLDIHKSKVMKESTPNITEQFTMSYEPQDTHVNIVLNWDKTMIKIPVSPTL